MEKYNNLNQEFSAMKKNGWNENDYVYYIIKVTGDLYTTKTFNSLKEADDYISLVKSNFNENKCEFELLLQFDILPIPWMIFLYMYYIGVEEERLPVSIPNHKELHKIIFGYYNKGAETFIKFCPLYLFKSRVLVYVPQF